MSGKHSSLKKAKTRKEEKKTKLPVTRQGKKYGYSSQNRLAKIPGKRSWGRARLPPIRGPTDACAVLEGVSPRNATYSDGPYNFTAIRILVIQRRR
jgi:hypothetical protein